MDSEHMERMTAALERQAAAFERLADSLALAAPPMARLVEAVAHPPVEVEPPKRERRERIKPEPLPTLAADDLTRLEREVFDMLNDLAGTNAARTRRAVRPVDPAGVRRAVADFPDRDHLTVAKNYVAWQLDSARSPHTNVVSGYRNQLTNAPAVARPTAPGQAQRPGLDRLMDDGGLEEAWK